MLRFLVFDNDGNPATDFQPTNAHLIGPDDLATAGTVRFEDGQVVCEKRGSQAVGVCLLCDAGEMGRLMLQTCLLPDRPEPYVLSIELARHRIKTFIAKSEEWQMFELSAEHPAMARWDKARQLLTKALITTDRAEADRCAKQSLVLAIDASERLAMAHAQILLHRRYGQRAASSATLGVRISPARHAPGLRQLAERDFDVISIPLNWRWLEVEEGRYDWEPVDRWMQWAKQTGKPIVAGPLLDFSRQSVPDWLYVWQHDYDTCRDFAYDHIERVVQRYGPVVNMWNIAAGMNVNDNFQFTAPQMMDLVRMASVHVRQSARGGRTMIELVQPFGEFAAGKREALAPMVFLDRVVQEGIRVDAVGVQVLFGRADEGKATRDLMQVSALLDRFHLLELPVIVSAMGVPSEQNGEDAGWWHDRWNAERQAKWIGQVFGLAMSKPYVESLIWGELYDHEHAVVPNVGVIDEQGRTKPALQRLVSARKRLRKPLGPLRLPNREDNIPAGS